MYFSRAASKPTDSESCCHVRRNRSVIRFRRFHGSIHWGFTHDSSNWSSGCICGGGQETYRDL